ncbi:MAG: tRNA lysidine(34) synthetase TilS [Ignavibacteria bacterium]|nr:tRNA lysidine(34) synthetase TilS [Ignavibacteria bacterium]
MKATEQKVLRFIKENDLFSSREKILIALSGGPDSIFLLHFLNKYKKKYKIEIGAAHINHLLRGNDSERDNLFCKTICDELSIPFYVLRKNIKSYAKDSKISLEVAGRKIRYEYFEKISGENGYEKIATAHNADDNAETVLINLIKGAGVKGIAGIPLKRKNIIRPILSLTKKEILHYLEENKFEYRIDKSNLSNEFERNFLRNEVIPLIHENINPALSKTVLNTSLNLQLLNNGMENYSEKIKAGIKAIKNISVVIPDDIIKQEEGFIISYVLKDIIDENFSVKLESNDLKKISSLQKKLSGKSEELSGNLIAFRERTNIFIQKKSSIKKIEKMKINIDDSLKINGKTLSIVQIENKELKINKSRNEEFISGDKIKTGFEVRVWQDGDKFFPIGMQGTKKISDYLNDIKINSFEKKDQLVLINSGKIVWVIGKRLDDRFKITSNTKKVLKLCLK